MTSILHNELHAKQYGVNSTIMNAKADYNLAVLLPVYMSCHGRAEPNTIKVGNSKANKKLNSFLPNLIIKYDLYVEPLPCQCAP